MGNIGSITTRRWIKVEQLADDLKAIIASKFDGKLPIKKEFSYFTIGFEHPWCIELWLENCHRIEFRAPLPKWSWWVRCVIENELALLYNGWISDEGVSERWRGVPDKYPRFRDYMKAMSEGVPTLFAAAWRVIETQHAPKEVKATYG